MNQQIVEKNDYVVNMKIKNLSIYKQIDTNFRDYALYTLESRGIPNWYDSLTNVQRISIVNAPTSFNKTISLVGDCIKDAYHHGDAGLGKSINRLTKTFGNSESTFNGDGFFGSPVNPFAAATRYTSLQINPKIKNIVNKYYHLNEKELDTYKPLHLEVPIGLFNHIIGIAIGWKTSILPRKLEDIQKYLAGEISTIKPYFQNYNGKIEGVKDTKKSWIISPSIKIDEKTFSLEITEIPHMIQYSKFLQKLYSWIDETGWNVTIQNNSNEKVSLILQLRNNRDKWGDFLHEIQKMTKILITETIIFIKDKKVIEYSCIEDYLDDYKIWLSEILYKDCQYKISINEFENLYSTAKLEYLKFMIEKKRKDDEINWFISQYNSEKIIDRLKSIKLNALSEEEIERTLDTLKKYREENLALSESLIKYKTDFDNKSQIEFKGYVAKKDQENINSNNIDGISEWDVEDSEDNDDDWIDS